ncbi:transcriptional repressor KorB C-terminal beta-barrel domain-containing protein [Thiolapillus sp.]|uniref:transcriptional repressor KorB C-terminal beta-barrel domain-containing protein n=1 Tax=Thiolapillus sp. TaxID=2017437 RepID=UPI003AF7431E
MREFLDDKQHGGDGDPQGGADDDNEEAEPKAKSKKPKEIDPDKLKKAIVVVYHDEKPGRLLLDRRPSQEGLAWVKYEMDGQEVEVDLLGVELVAVVEA